MPKPPFSVSAAALKTLTQLERLIGQLEGGLGALAVSPQLRRSNRIQTVQATTAIEGNTLTLDQVTDLLDGKRVRGSARDIAEVKNALAAYELAGNVNPFDESDLLRVHAALMHGLVEDAGRYRRGNVGVIAGSRVTHVAPPADRVPHLMRDLVAWVAGNEDAHTLVLAAVAHYELEFIHPFSDGNGRMGRWWHHALSLTHGPALGLVPLETLIRAEQQRYYDVLSKCDKAGDCTPFVEFILALQLAGLKKWQAERPALPRIGTAERLELARLHFGERDFSRKDYLALHRGVSAPTASRDLQAGVRDKVLVRRGADRTSTYRFR